MDTSSATPALADVLDRARQFVDEELVPVEPLLLQGDFDMLATSMDAARQRARDLGLWNPHLPADEGGLGLGLDGFGRVSEVLGRSPLGHYACNCQAPDAGNMELMLAHATDAQRCLLYTSDAADE